MYMYIYIRIYVCIYISSRDPCPSSVLRSSFLCVNTCTKDRASYGCGSKRGMENKWEVYQGYRGFTRGIT